MIKNQKQNILFVKKDETYFVEVEVQLLTDKPVEIKAISATGLEAVCEIIPYEDDDY